MQRDHHASLLADKTVKPLYHRPKKPLKFTNIWLFLNVGMSIISIHSRLKCPRNKPGFLWAPAPIGRGGKANAGMCGHSDPSSTPPVVPENNPSRSTYMMFASLTSSSFFCSANNNSGNYHHQLVCLCTPKPVAPAGVRCVQVALVV